MTQRVAYPDDPIMAAAWLGCVKFLSAEPEAIAAFEKQTGHRWVFASDRSGIERMVDQATGHEQTVIDAFIDWVNENHWGEDPFAAQ